MINLKDYYIILISVGLFIAFALVGYLVEVIKKSKEETDEYDKEFKDLEFKEIDLEKKEIVNEEIKNNDLEIPTNKADELLENYNNENNL